MKLNSKKQRVTFIVFGIVLIILYGKNICLKPTVWELGDEAMYIWNAAYMSGFDWSGVQYNAYFGFGYSLFLIPSFFFAKTGIDIIRWAFLVNLLFVIGAYIVISLLLWNISCKSNSLGLPFIAFIACINPAVYSNTIKVVSETCLFFFYCFGILLFYFAVTKRKYGYYLGTAMVYAFEFFVHTRSIVNTIAVSMLLLLVCIKEKGRTRKQLILYGCVFFAAFAALYNVKQYLMDGILKNAISSSEDMANIINSHFITDRIKWIFATGIWNYICCFMAKLFYSVYETGGMIVWAFCYIIKCAKKFMQNQSYDGKEITVILVLLSYTLTIIACTFTGTGSNAQYAFYGRYFEYTIPLVMVCGIYYFIYIKNENLKFIFALWCIVILAGIIVKNWCLNFLPDQSIVLDTCRLAAFSRALTNEAQLDQVLLFIISMISVCFAAQAFCSRYNVKIMQFAPILLTGIILWDNCDICASIIHKAHMSGEADAAIAEYIYQKYDNQDTIFIDDKSYHYDLYYSRMQVLLFDKEFKVQDNKDGIKNGDYVILYNGSEMDMDGYELLMKGSVFKLYKKLLV